MSQATNIITNALVLSALYAMVATGFTLIFSIGGIMNIGHGANIAIGGFAGYYAAVYGLGIWPGFILALLIPGIFSAVMYLGLIKPVEDKPITVIIITLLVLLITEQFFQVLVGTNTVFVPTLMSGSVEILGQDLLLNNVLMFGLSWTIIGALLWFVNMTQTGRAIEATSMSSKGANLVGIDQARVTLYTWFIAGTLAGAAGLFLATSRGASWDMGLNPLLLAFTIVILGGIGSIKGSIIGAYIIGTIDVATQSLINPQYTGLFPLILLVILLMVRPEGLWGHAEVE